MSDLKNIINDAFENKGAISLTTTGRIRDAVNSTLDQLDEGSLRVSEKVDGEWFVNQWVKKAILLSFRLNDNEISKGIVEFTVIKHLRSKENPKEIWLAFSPIKSNFFNFMIQKSTELGITKFLPIIFERTIVRKINKQRLEKVIIEASEQSNRIYVPIIEKPQNLKSFLSKNKSKMSLIFTDLNSKNI